MQRNLNAGIYQRGPLSPKHEHAVHAFQDMVRRGMADHPAPAHRAAAEVERAMTTTPSQPDGAAAAKRYDAIIIGAGHNGLVCANYLARAGLKVLVLERRKVLGGAAVTEEIAPGFRASIFSYLMSLLHPRIIRDFELKQHGLEVLPCSDMVSPVSNDDYIVFSDDMAKTQASFAKFSKKDAAIYPEFDRYLQEAAQIVRKLLWETPVDPARRDWRGFRDGASLLWRYRKIGRKMYRLADMLTMSAYDFLREWFEDDRVMAVLAYYASIGTFAGPKTPGSAYVIMHHIMGEHEGAGGWGFIKGGMGAITQALASLRPDARASRSSPRPRSRRCG